jgi:LysM repeat protein
MLEDKDPQEFIESYRKKQQWMPFVLGGIAVILVVVGIVVLVMSMSGSGGISLFATKTPTPTITYTPTPITPTATVTLTPTVTDTPEPTVTLTPSGPFEYTVLENDSCWDIAIKYEVDINVLLALNNFGSGCPIKPGDKILIPAPNQKLPTETPLPTNIARGTKIEYVLKSGDSLDMVAAKFNSTIEAILKENKIAEADANKIFAGEKIIVPVNLVTATPTLAPTSTSAAAVAATATATVTPAP